MESLLYINFIADIFGKNVCLGWKISIVKSGIIRANLERFQTHNVGMLIFIPNYVFQNMKFVLKTYSIFI